METLNNLITSADNMTVGSFLAVAAIVLAVFSLVAYKAIKFSHKH